MPGTSMGQSCSRQKHPRLRECFPAVTLLIFLLTIMAGLLINCGGETAQTPGQVVEAYLESANSGDMLKACKYLKESEKMSKYYEKDNLLSGAAIAFMPEVVKGEYKVHDESVSQNSATVVIHKERPGKRTYVVEYKLENIKGEWKIVSGKFSGNPFGI